MMHPFDLTAGLGEQLREAAAVGMMATMDAECDSDGFPWPELSPKYEEWKQTYAPGAPMAVLDGVMKTAVQLLGVAGITADAMHHHYGTEELAKEHALKFQEGGAVTGDGQPPRPFWGFTAWAIDTMNAACDAAFVRATG